MKLKKTFKVITVGTVLLLADVYSYQVPHSSAEEIAVVESAVQLKSLAISEFQLDQIFTSEVSSYTASVSNDVDNMHLQLETIDDSASVTINGESVESGVETAFSLVTGENIFSIVVTSGTETYTYTLTVMREQNDDNQLAKLALSSGNLEFYPAITNYNVKVDSEIDKITVKPEVATGTSTAKINGTVVEDEGYTMELPFGTSTISIIVTAENGAVRTYKIMIDRTEESNGNIDQSDGTNNSKGNLDLSEEKDNLNGNMGEQPTKNTSSGNNQGTLVTIPQQLQSNREASSMSSGSGFDATGTAVVEKQTKANLSSLTVSDGTWNKSFTSDAYTYHIALGNDVSSVTISGNPEESDAELAIEGNKTTSSATITIGEAAQMVISVAVTYENERKTYVLVFEKDGTEE